MDPNNNRMQMWMKTTRGTLTPRNEQCVSFKTHCANTGPKRADLPQATKNEFPGARLPCTLMSGAPRSPASQLPHPLTSSPHAMSKPRMHLTGFRAGGNSLEKGDNEFSQLRISTRQFPHRSLASAAHRPGIPSTPGGIDLMV